MLILLQTVLVIFVVVILAEILWRAKLLESEHSRKLVHIVVGTFAATWGFYLDDPQILLLSGAMFAVVLVSRLFGLFASIHTVKRKTWGELFFPIGIALCALLTDSPWIFLAAILHVSLADGLAALVGRRYVKKHGYKIFKQQKTLVGTLTFFIASTWIILLTLIFATDLEGNIAILMLVPLAATVAENLGIMGADDVLVPLIVTTLLVSL